MQNRSSITVLLHSIFWILWIHLIFDLTLLHEFFTTNTEEEIADFYKGILLIFFSILLFYWNSEFLIPRFFKSKWRLYLSALILSYSLGTFLMVCFSLLIENLSGGQLENEIEDFIVDVLIVNLLILAMSSAWGVTKVVFENAAKNQEAKRKQEDAELNFLMAQVNPHFLYNTLNGIYAQALEENAKKTTEMILQLSEIMRYPFINVTKKGILLTEEITFIEKFIVLQKLRLGETYPITFTKKGNFNEVEVLPFIFIPLVENAFKYGISQKDKSPIFFHLELREKELIFTAKNKKININETKSNLIGIHNLRERLNLKYGNQSSLKVTEDEKNYSIELKVNMDMPNRDKSSIQ